jgi:D-alanyl-D-alanine carboxypeptidase
MKYRALALVIVATLALTVPAAKTFGQTAPPAVGMAAGLMLDLENGKILWSREPEAPRAPASLTKMLTALLVLEKLKLTDRVVITHEARYADGARIYAEEGWTFSVEDLLWGLLLESGNDVAVALAQKASPDTTLEGFVKMMNDRAHKLGATGSSFRNPHGLDEPQHVTSARDLALIAGAAMRNETFANMVGTQVHKIPWGDGEQRTFTNGNKLLANYPGAVGIKTGFTTEAGKALASAVRRDGTTLVAVVLGSPDHYQDSILLYDWAFANLPVLEGRPLGVLQLEAQKATQADPARGLEIVQYDPRAPTSSGGDSAILVVPLLVLAGVIVAGKWIRDRLRPRPAFETEVNG